MWRLFVFALLLVTPFICRNFILSGYPLFPIYQIDPFLVNWKADREKTIEILNYVKYYNRVNGQMDLSQISIIKFPAWITIWYHFLFYYDKILVALSGLSYLAYLFLKKSQKKYNPLLYVLFASLILQLLSWILVAPDPRFAYGPLLFGIYILVFTITPSSSIIFSSKKIKLYGIIISIFTFVYCATKVKSKAYENWVTPYPLPVPPVKTIIIDGIELRIPEKVLNNWNPRCYGTELPCLYEVDPRLKARGKTIREGFKLEK
ncbi:MAG TPA: hypothetical protein VMT76_09990 [Puia sp.]|nr:hypothetical protein [Puia sp.]